MYVIKIPVSGKKAELSIMNIVEGEELKVMVDMQKKKEGKMSIFGGMDSFCHPCYCELDEKFKQCVKIGN